MSILQYCAIVVACLGVGMRLFIMHAQSDTSYELPSVTGHYAIITGGNTGLGFETAQELSLHGAHVILACRNQQKCEAAASKINALGGEEVTPMLLDLADPVSITQFATAYKESHTQLHMLYNNAAIMATPFKTNAQGVEAQFAVNHLGHFQLTQLLLDVLKATKGARIINHSSSASDMCPTFDVASFGRVAGDEYSPWGSYGCSKRANRYFTWGLNQRLKDTGVIATMCHPGYAATDLQGRATGNGAFVAFLLENLGNTVFAQTAAMGAQPQLMAGTDGGLKGGELIGPKYFMYGAPVVETSEPLDLGSDQQCEQKHVDELWALSEELIQVY